MINDRIQTPHGLNPMIRNRTIKSIPAMILILFFLFGNESMVLLAFSSATLSRSSNRSIGKCHHRNEATSTGYFKVFGQFIHSPDFVHSLPTELLEEPRTATFGSGVASTSTDFTSTPLFLTVHSTTSRMLSPIRKIDQELHPTISPELVSILALPNFFVEIKYVGIISGLGPTPHT
jgi:hypothetical protein